jgi:hypothetical protein
MRATILQIVSVQGESMDMHREDLAKLCRQFAHKCDGLEPRINGAHNGTQNGTAVRPDLRQKVLSDYAAAQNKDVADVLAATTGAIAPEILATKVPSKKSKGEPMFVQLSQKGGAGTHQPAGGRRDMQGYPQGGDLQTMPAARNSDQRMVQKPRIVKNFVGQFVQPEARQPDGNMWNGINFERPNQGYMETPDDNFEDLDVDRRSDKLVDNEDEDGYGNNYHQTDDERSEPSEYGGDCFSNMRIVTPDFLGGSWDIAGSDRIMSSYMAPSFMSDGSSNSTELNFVGNPSQIAQQMGAQRSGSGQSLLFDSAGGQPDKAGRRGINGRFGPMPLRVNRLALQRNPTAPSAMATLGIAECEEENFVSFHSDRGKEEMDMMKNLSFQSEGKSRQRPSWADEDPADVDITPLFKLEWTETHPSLSRED